MKKSNQIILGALSAIFIFSIAFQLNVNRHLRNTPPKSKVIKNLSEERAVGVFDKISVSHGIEVYFIQNSITQIKVVAPEAIMPFIKTEVKSGELIIEKIEQTKSKDIVKVSISNDQLRALKARSGAYFETIGEVTGENLVLEFSSDTKANLELSFQSIQCKAASGSQIKFKGNTSNIEFTN